MITKDCRQPLGRRLWGGLLLRITPSPLIYGCTFSDFYQVKHQDILHRVTIIIQNVTLHLNRKAERPLYVSQEYPETNG